MRPSIGLSTICPRGSRKGQAASAGVIPMPEAPLAAGVDTLVKPSVCPLDCPDTCSLSVEVKGDEIVKVRGSKANPYTAGVICNKVARYYPEFVHGPARLTKPLKRTGPRGSDQFELISWDEALDLIHAGFTRAI